MLQNQSIRRSLLSSLRRPILAPMLRPNRLKRTSLDHAAVLDTPEQRAWQRRRDPGLPDCLDLYGPQIISGVHNVFKLPEKKREHRLAATYHQAIKYCAKVPGPANADINVGEGEFHWSQCPERFGDDPYNIADSDVSSDVEIKLGTQDQAMKGYQLKLELEDDGCSGDSGEATMKIRKAGQGKENEVLYECHVEINVDYSNVT